MKWRTDQAPENVAVRVRILDRSRFRELAYPLIRIAERWYYATSMVPIYSWHEPHSWSDTPRCIKELESFRVELNRLYGTLKMPSCRTMARK